MKETSPTPPRDAQQFPDLPRPITSFGAAVVDDAVYVYGGHHGKAHHYYEQGQSGDLLRLRLDRPDKWEVVNSGPRLQGLAMVAHNGKLYRVGGFEARNREDEEQSLWSVADFARFDFEKEKWEQLPPMPSPRSSFDATVADGVLYVIGGWALAGENPETWQETAYAFDLNAENATWTELPKPPFQRRALAVGAHQGKIYAIGGMQPTGKVTRRTAVYDPQSRQWSDGPELPGEDMDGFGAAACTQGDRLCVGASSGKLLRLTENGEAWEQIQKLQDGRFFHQMVPIGTNRLLLIGGANMERGKYATVESVLLR